MTVGRTQHFALADRLQTAEQLPTQDSVATFPPYLDAFLAHLRLLVGVPFHYLVPDSRLLPPESIRFFYLDRSWTDRLVDGALAVGKIGTRELAHTQRHASAVHRSIDDSESLVRDLQRRRVTNFADVKESAARERLEAATVTGFLLRSALVSGWPHLEVRAFQSTTQLTILRLERLAPSVMIALFRGVPDKVEIEQPHHGVQFGIDGSPGSYRVFLRGATGHQIRTGTHAETQAVPVRVGGRNVVHVAELRKRLHARRAAFPTAVEQTGPGAFAISVLNPPYRQPFSGAGAAPDTRTPLGDRVVNTQLMESIRLFLGGRHG
jgi:hypothetical protein